MARLGYCILTCFNLVILGIGIAILAVRPLGTCYSLLYMPLVILGFLIVVLSLLGLLGLCCRSPLIMWLHLALYTGFILVIAFIVVLEITVMSKEVVRLKLGKAENPHDLDEFSKRLRDHVVGAARWPRIRHCLTDHDVCAPGFGSTYGHLQKGCCNAPLSCGSQQNNSMNPNLNQGEDPDCKEWKYERDTLCYNCETCKAGFLAQFADNWIRAFPIIVATLIILIIIFSLGCHVLRAMKASRYQKHYYPTP